MAREETSPLIRRVTRNRDQQTIYSKQMPGTVVGTAETGLQDGVVELEEDQDETETKGCEW